ncbi:hypothetical protein GLOIN_2v1774597 [Rhizophagus clarus]|uniref:F-box domain-containing protein n=1 Tax=Rhizophagus clarus TaxID=94130 RepID=A0A8H3QRF0_9GLOM|nr:hypothetical protein GLOIN_2v1774597 [Rhizophagus clarus]
MDATYLPELCMKEILIDLKNHPSSLLKCSLLNHHWNQYFLPELWKNPFTKNFETKINSKRLIETLIQCLTINEKRSIIKDSNIINKNPYLMYTKYLKVIDLNNLVSFIILSFPVNHHLQIYKLLCFNFITNSKNISKIILSKHSVFNNNTDIFLYSNSRNLSTLKEIEFNGVILSNLIYNCSKICNDLRTITFYDLFERYTGDKYFNLKNLIKSQKNLKNLNIHGFLISQNRYLYEAIKFQAHSLNSINFTSIDFNKHCNLSYLTKCENLVDLQFLNCNFYGNLLSNKIINIDLYKNEEENDYYSDEDVDIIHVDINFRSNFFSKLNFLKFENCNQFGFYDNYSLILLIFGKNLKRFHIIGESDSINYLRSIDLLSIIITKCENLEELQISKCFIIHNNNNNNNNNNINNNSDIIVDQIIRSKLKFLKFEDCNQLYLLKNSSLILSFCGQNLNYLYIRGKEILEITKNLNLLLLLSTNCFNLKLLKLSIHEKFLNYIPTLFISCQKLEMVSFNNYDQKNLINIDLSKIGFNLPPSLKKFTMKMNLFFTPENFKEFLIHSKNLEE